MKKGLILGGSGLVGGALINELTSDYNIYGTYNKRTINLQEDKKFKFELNNYEEIITFIDNIKPDFIISCLRGDFNDQYKCHIDIANHIKDKNINFYFCSTANVFDGDAKKPHYEDEKTNSISDYGKFKIQCENSLSSILKDKLCILRLPEMWGKNSPRFNYLINKLKSNEPIEVYSNYYKTTNLDVMLAKQIHYIINHNLKGIFHLNSSDIINNYDFFIKLINKLGYENPSLKKIQIDEEEKYYLAVNYKNSIFPANLTLSNEDIINYLSKDYHK